MDAPTNPLRKSEWAAAIGVVLLAVACIHGPLVRTDPLLDRDDDALVGPMREVHSLADYVSLVRANRVMDVQPVRDASFKLDLVVSGWVGHGTFHLTNVLLFLCFVVLSTLVLGRLAGLDRVVLVVVTLLALHPLMANVVPWVSARKHLLAADFCLLATWLALRGGVVSEVGAVVAFGLAVFSQPIVVAWPAWLALVRVLERAPRRAYVVPVASLAVAATGVWLNLGYYGGAAYEAHGAAKFSTDEARSFVALLSLGRSFLNVVAPVRLVTQYDATATLNLVGLLALVVAIPLALAFLDRRRATVFGGLFFFPLAVVTVRLTQIFVSDTYLLLPSVGVAGLLVLALRHAPERILWPLALAVAVVAVPLSRAQAGTWSSDAALWAHAAATEPTPNALAKRAFSLIDEGRFDEALAHAEALAAWDPGHPEAGLVLAKAVALRPDWAVPEKRAYLAAHPLDQAWFHYFSGGLALQAGDVDGACTRLTRALSEPRPLRDDVGNVAAEATFACVRANRSGEPAATIVQAARASPLWSEARFGTRCRQLGLTNE